MEVKFILILIISIIFFVLIGYLVYQTYFYDPCDWKVVNCCYNVGSVWECVDVRNFKPNCSKFVLCPNIKTEKPQQECVYENGRCVVK